MAATGPRSKIFISYRREDAADAAGRIRDWLVQTQRIAREDVFMDVATILPGADFGQVIEQAIGQCKAMIVVISPAWLTQVNMPGSSYLRLEAETALRHNLLVIPVLVGGAKLPQPAQLPEALRPLLRRNVRAVRPDSFDYDMDWVRRSLGLKGRIQVGWTAAVSAIVLAALGAGILTQIPQGNPVWLAFHPPTATATATATLSPTFTPTTPPIRSYTAAAPGPGCDSGPGHWVNRPGVQSGPISCQTGMTVLEASRNTLLDFDWPGHPFPQSYTLAVNLLNPAQSTCAGFGARQTLTNNTGYDFVVCATSNTPNNIFIDKRDPAGNSTIIAQGQLPNATHYFALEVTLNGPNLKFVVDNGSGLATGNPLTLSASDTSYTQTDYITLFDYTFANPDASVGLSQFLYSPQV